MGVASVLTSPTSHSACAEPRLVPNRIPALDGLRGMAILLVLLWHFFFAVSWTPTTLQILRLLGKLSWSGVDLFFVLSGFLIGGILLDARNSPSYFRTFYARRAYRILPLYTVIVAINYFVPFLLQFFPARFSDFQRSQVPFLGYLTFTQNFCTAFGLKETYIAGVTWSLAIEEQFYLTMPLLIRTLTRSRLMWVLLAVILGAPLLRIFLHYTLKDGNYAAYVLMPSRPTPSALGSCPPCYSGLLACGMPLFQTGRCSGGLRAAAC